MAFWRSLLLVVATNLYVDLENVMTTLSRGFEFELPSNGSSIHYIVNPVHNAEGHLQKLMIWHNPPADGTVADIEIDPQLFTQFAMPNVETVCRIAIAQAATEGAFDNQGTCGAGMTLDFAIEPWEGQLAEA